MRKGTQPADKMTLDFIRIIEVILSTSLSLFFIIIAYKNILVNDMPAVGVSKRRVKGSQRGKKGQQPLDDERDRGLSVIRNGCRPEQKQQEPPGDFPVFWESICFAVPA